MEKVLLISIKLKSESDKWSFSDITSELEELASACSVDPVDAVTVSCEKPTANFFIGKGKVEEIAALAQEQGVDTVIFSRDLSGTQQRNLEEVIGKKTIDRTQLILDIFARHARTLDGKMQVELAQLQYLMPRLIGKGIILSRTGGGIGTSGPGEQKLEVDRRRIRKKIDRLKSDLRHLSLRRQTLRKKRQENAVPSIALVGYTNAGKSTLLNALTGSGQVVHNGLFTTLDPLSKSFKLPNGEQVVVSDTVGFLYNLPHHLIEAFKATLEEVIESDLLIHVLDVSHSLVHEHNKAVYEVLKDLDAGDKPIITVLNKIDLLEDQAGLRHLTEDFDHAVAISAKSGQNFDQLLARIEKNFQGRMVTLELEIPHTRMDLMNLFYKQGHIQEADYQQEHIKVKVSLPRILALKVQQELL